MTTEARGRLERAQPSRSTINRMGRGGGLNLVGAVCNQLSLFAIISVLAGLGEREVGRYASCFALLSLLGLLSLAGFRSAMTRFVAMHVADDDARRLRGTVRLGLGLTVAASVVIGAALALSAPWLAPALGDEGLTTGIRLVGLTLPAATISDAALAATQGWRTQVPFTVIGRIVDPVARLVLTALALAAGLGVDGALWALAISSWASAILALRSLRKRLRPVPRVPARYEVREIFGFSMVSWVSALAATGLIWVDTLLLGALRGQHDVGAYNVATRLVMLAVFVMAPINASFTPHLAHLVHTDQREEAARAYGSAARWILVLSMPSFILLVAFSEQLLGYFGRGYRSAAAVTAILALGQLVSAAAGPCGTVLNMSGRVMLNMLDNVGVLVLNIVLNLVLIPRYGVVGAAIAWSASLVTANVVKVLQAQLVVGIHAAGAGLGKVAAATVPAVGAAWLVSRWVATWTDVLLVAAPAVVVVFFGALVALGLDAEDKALTRSLLRGKAFRRRAVEGRA
ncbi:flippase [Pedococcus sp. 2YAF34]|uniref:flippase n=1 Tax=Pedococcus sp. 2YAF34 TaxID=3233032 RepID=UPI003F97CB94